MRNIKPYNSLIQKILNEMEQENSSLNSIKDSSQSLASSYKKNLEAISQFRGRPPLYPYISSGKGRGPYVQLEDGSTKLDFICGIGPHILGHSHPEMIRAALQGALEDQIMQGHLQFSSIYQKTLNQLTSIASRNSRLKQAWICPSGSMANENALKVIRQKQGGARMLLAFERAFAGRTTLTAEITDNPTCKQGLPSYDEVLRVPFTPNDPDKALQVLKKHWEKHGKDISCFIMELMQGDGGCWLAPREFFVSLMDFCKEKGIAIWLDEIQTFCRSGEFFAFEKLKLGEYVDVCTVGKTLQLSASLWTNEYNPKPGLVSGTFASSSTSFYGALTLLKFLDENNYMGESGIISQIYNKWTQALKTLEAEGLLSEIEGWGLMIGATPLDGNPNRVAKLLQVLFRRGLICFSCGAGAKKRLRFLLPAILEDSHLEEALQVLKSSLLEVKQTG